MRSVIDNRLKKLEAVMIPEKPRKVHLIGVTDLAPGVDHDAAVEARKAELIAELIGAGRATADDEFIALVSLRPNPKHPALSEARGRLN